MDFSFSEDQIAIRDLASQIFTDRTTDEFMLAFNRSGHVYDDELWDTLAEQGLLGVTVPEEFGGTGLAFTDLCLMLEEQGRRISPIPLYSSLVLGALPLIEFGTSEQKEKYLRPLASGKLKLSAAVAELGISDAVAGQVSATRTSDGWVLNGTLDCVPDAPTAQAILVPAYDGDQQTFFIVDTDLAGVSIEARRNRNLRPAVRCYRRSA
jgi:alkylation response protein AidB-like acyl-CoA dehydrogenase